MSLWQFAPPELRWLKIRRDLAIALFDLSLEVRIREEIEEMSFTGYTPGAIRRAIDKAKQESQAELNSAMKQLALAQNAAAQVPVAIRQIAKAISKEAADGLQEVAEFSNGGPSLDEVTIVNDLAPPAKTPLPPPVGINGIVTPAPVDMAAANTAIIEPAK